MAGKHPYLAVENLLYPNCSGRPIVAVDNFGLHPKLPDHRGLRGLRCAARFVEMLTLR